MVRLPIAVSEPAILHRVQNARSVDGVIHVQLADATRQFGAELRIGAFRKGIRFRLKVSAPEPLWLVEWKLSGLNLDEVIVPALGGQSLNRSMPMGKTVAFKYPFWWNSQFVIGARGKGGFWLYSRDEAPSLKMLRVGRSEAGFELTFGFEADAPLDSPSLRAEWFMDAYSGDWKVPVDIHRAWLEKVFHLVPLHKRLHFPHWARDINFVLELWGAKRDDLTPAHTFREMMDRLRAWKELHTPENTLVYLPGFAENGIDSNIPSYNPSPQADGDNDFGALVDMVHDMGFRVMIHTNVLGMSYGHEQYSHFKDHQVVDPFGRPQGWGLIWMAIGW